MRFTKDAKLEGWKQARRLPYSPADLSWQAEEGAGRVEHRPDSGQKNIKQARFLLGILWNGRKKLASFFLPRRKVGLKERGCTCSPFLLLIFRGLAPLVSQLPSSRIKIRSRDRYGGAKLLRETS
jgi:hypothetical protein